ncbi:hypothetical protein [Streptococcus peroris]|nr:hypothetical protein [Streptococcus peroris]
MSKIWNHAILVELTMHMPVQPLEHRRSFYNKFKLRHDRLA